MRYSLKGFDAEARLAREHQVKHRTCGANEVRLRVAAASLNYRDLLILKGLYPMPRKEELVPVSDGAGTIVEVGSGVEGLSVGARVMTNFFVDWTGGRVEADLVWRTLGSTIDGVLATEAVLPASAVTPIPDALDFAAAATLPCAAVTAWNALFYTAHLEPGDTVLLQGTGGVSTFALQFAKARGLRVIQTSSSDEKLADAQRRGADFLINYHSTPDWDVQARDLTEGRGVDAVVEIGGAGTLDRSIRATRMEGTIAAIGLVSGVGKIDPLPILTGVVRVAGVYVGSHSMAWEMLAQIQAANISPVIDRTFRLADAEKAYDYLEAGRAGSGKVVIDCTAA